VGTRYEPVPVCDADKLDAKAVRKFAWTEDDGATYTIELGDDEEHECYRAVMEILDNVREHATPIVVEVVGESLPLLNVDHQLEGAEPEEAPEPTAEPEEAPEPPAEREEVPEPAAKTSGEREEAPEPLSLISTELTAEQRTRIREWWAKSGKAKHAFGDPTNRGRLAQGLVDLYCDDMNRRAARAREKELV
jgi:hypothetical protein